MLTAIAQPPAWANVSHINSWLPQRFWPKALPVVATVHHLVHDAAYDPFRSRSQAAYHRLVILPRERRAILRADAVTTVSNYVKKTLKSFSERADVSVIENWIEEETFCLPELAPSAHNQPFILFMAGCHSRRKGADLLPTFAKSLGSDFQIRCTGSPPNCRSLPNLYPLGRVTDQQLVGEFQRCDAVVSLSRYEGFGYTALEAAVCGKPFLGFNTSALTEVAMAGAGTLVPVDDVASLANAARNLRSQSPPTLEQMKCRREQILQRFNKHSLDAYIDIYARVISKYNFSQ